MNSPPAPLSLLEDLTRQVPGVIYQFRMWPDGRSCFPFASEAIREIYEVSPEEVREDASIVFTRVHPDDLAAGLESVRRSAADLSMWDWDYRVVLPRRGMRHLHGRARPERLDDGSTLWHGYINDVTERRAEHDELLRLQAAIKGSITGIAIADLDGTVTYANAAALQLWGFTDAHKVLGRHVSEFWASSEQARASYEGMARHDVDTAVMTALRGDGSTRRFQVRANVIRDEVLRPLGIIASFLDITEMEETASALQLRDLAMATSLSAMGIADPEGRMSWANPAFARMFGYDSVEQVVGADALEMLEGIGGPRVLAEMLKDGSWQGETTGRRRDGSTFDVLLAANVVRDAAGQVRHLMASIADITEAKRLQAQLNQSQKMQTVGRLAGGVAHDFNNLLTVMKGFLALARAQTETGGPLAQDLSEVDHAVDSAAALTQQLLAFSRRQIIVPRILDLNEAVREMHAILARALGDGIELRLDLAPTIGRVRFDPNQMEQVLINLAMNARDAMAAGGRFTIATSDVQVSTQEAAREPALRSGPHVLMTVTDTGTGMTDEVRAQLFEPFFTTKPSGKGTGLGLAMVYGAITQCDGRIEVESEPGGGATFRIYLPRLDETAPRRITPSDTVLPRGTETVVVVEDEPAIRLLTVRILEKQGYRVLSYANGREAHDALCALDEEVKLMVTDVVMPEMNGRQLADAMAALRPRMRVLFVSGYPQDAIGRQGVLEDGVDFLAKPYSVTTLAQRVRDALDRPGAT